jgi:hypothetical protein
VARCGARGWRKRPVTASGHRVAAVGAEHPADVQGAAASLASDTALGATSKAGPAR